MKKSSFRNKAILTTAIMTASGLANATLPTGIATGLSTIQTDALALFDLAWPVVLAVFGGGILFKLFKRAGNKI